MCCIDDDYRKNGALAGLFALGTAVASGYLIFEFLMATGTLAVAGLISFTSTGFLTSVMALVCVIRMNEILRRDIVLRRVTKGLLVVSILTIPMPVYALIAHIEDQKSKLYGGRIIDDRRIPIYVELGLMAFYILLCANIFCSIQGAAEERRFHEGEAKYHQVTKEEMEERQFKSDNFLENQLSGDGDPYMELSYDRHQNSFVPSEADDEMSVYDHSASEKDKKKLLAAGTLLTLGDEKKSFRSRRRGSGKGRNAEHSLHRSDFSLTTDDGLFEKVELELGASDDEKNSLAYSVYSEQRKKKPVLPTQVSVPKAKKKSQAKRANSSNESSENY